MKEGNTMKQPPVDLNQYRLVPLPEVSMDAYRLLVEALRRYGRFGEGKSLTEAWTGLGSKTTYKPVLDKGYMEFIHEYHPRCIGWLRLTEKGARIVQAWLDAGYDWKRLEAGDWPPKS